MMMKQMTLATAKGFEVHGRAKRKAEFLARMEGLVPWAEMCGLIEPHYPKAGNGRPPVGLGRERVPDSTTLVNFRHLLEPHELGAAVFAKVGQLLQANGMKLSGGTIVDATLIAAPPSTKRQEHSRDPEMHQSKKGNQWYFGMKVQIGVDSESGLIHSASVTPGNVHDSHALANLPHGQETRLYGDSAYRGAEQRQRLWGFTKVRYRGLTKSANRTFAMLAMLNLVKWGRPSRGKCVQREKKTGESREFGFKRPNNLDEKRI